MKFLSFHKNCFFFLNILFLSPLYCHEPTLHFDPSYKTIYKSLSPNSLSQYLAFYQLYPHTEEGKKALDHAKKLLGAQDAILPPFPKIDLSAFLSLLQNPSSTKSLDIKEETLNLINTLGKTLKNRSLKGNALWSSEEILEKIPPEEIDIARTLFLAEMGSDESCKKKIFYYEACLDLMSLQILAALPPHPTPLDKIHAINQFLFYEMRFRFPPHSTYAPEIDTYTFLSSVIEERKGVCLGVSLLYLSLAQRLNLSLEAVTPPGHIYLRLPLEEGQHQNIETTARGIHLPSEIYLGIETYQLRKRDHKELIGFALMNQASTFLEKKDFSRASCLYEQALLYVPEDPWLKELLAYTYLFLGKKEKGKKILKELQNPFFPGSTTKNTIPEDYLSGKVDEDGIFSLYLSVDETRASLLKKKALVETSVKKFPKFRSGLLQLAVLWLQLGREKEALSVLLQYEKIDPSDPLVNYYLSVISFKRADYPSAWIFFKKTKELLKNFPFHPEAFHTLQESLQKVFPVSS